MFELVRDNLASYSAVATPGTIVAPHHELISRNLEDLEARRIRRLIIEAPPRHGKSELASKHFVSWYLGRNPRHNVIASTYAQDLANDVGRKVRDTMLSPEHRSVFPNSSLRVDTQAVANFMTSENGAYVGVGIGGPITGRGANLLLCDDAVKNAEEAASPLIRERHKQWWRTTAYTRLAPDAVIVIIMTRWHEDDLVGWILEEQRKRIAAIGPSDDDYEVLCLSAVAEANDPLERPAGAALWPEFYPAKTLGSIKRTIGSRAFNALYQQRPTPDGGTVFKRSWVRYYTTPPAKFDGIYGSWDCAFKGTDTSDFVVGQVWGQVGAQFYLLDQQRGRMDFPATCAAIKAQRAKWPTMRACYVEDKANGSAVMSTLRATVPRLVPIDPQGGKLARASAVTGLFEAGNVFLPAETPWIGEYVEELCGFPSVAHDDQVDATTQALAKLSVVVGPARGVLTSTLGV